MAGPVRTIAVSVVIIAGVVILANVPIYFPVAQAGAPKGQNDAGSGQDAGDTPAHALLIPSGTRTFSGNLSPAGTDIDWYRHSTTAAFCSIADSTLSTAGQLIIAADPLQITAAARDVTANTAVTLALAAPAGHTPYLGIQPGPSQMQSTSGPSSPGRYSFKFQSLGLGDLDPERDGEMPEAGPTATTAVALPGPCSAGRLSATGDTADSFYYDINEAREITLSLAVAQGDANIQLSLISPSGAITATVASGQLANVYATETGRWNLVVSRTSAAGTPTSNAVAPPLLSALHADAVAADTETDYFIGLIDGGPDPCRPSC